MSGKAKMRCARCHKPFRASSAKQTLCAECEAKERRARATSKASPVTPTAAAPVAKPKIVGPGANILVPGLVPPPPPAASAPSTPPAARRPEYAPDRDRDHEHQRAQVAAQAQPGQSYPRPQPRPYPQQPPHGAYYGGRGAQGRPPSQQRPGQPRPPAPSRPKREPAPVISLTPELRERIETRYRELADPVEFDGIRTRIATELAVPKSLVKKAVLELRQRDQMPSWWELQGFHGSDEELGRIRAAYAPHLPLPAVGIHKQIAADLGLDAGGVYQAIRRIRAEMHLPQFNPPDAHATEAQGVAATGQGDGAAQGVAAQVSPAAPGGEAPHATAG